MREELAMDSFTKTKKTPDEMNPDLNLVLANAEKASVWLPWYFKRGVLTFLTVPFFLMVAISLTASLIGSFLQGFAMLRVSGAVFGFLGAFIAICVGWIPLILPPAIMYSLLKNFPGLWLRQDTSKRQKIFGTIAITILLPLIAQLIYSATVFGIGWIADQNPCAAYHAGFIGSKVPTNCLLIK
jgi:hypothetical protein